MKIKINPRRIAAVFREVVVIIQYVLGLVAIIIVASLVPGDNQDISTLGAGVGLFLLALLDAGLSLPLLYAAKRLERPVLEPVQVRSDW